MTYIFDMGGILVDIDVQGFIKRFAALMPPEIRFVASPDELLAGGGESFLHDYEMGTIGTEEVLRNFHALCRPEVTDEQIRLAWFSELAPVSAKVKNLLKCLKSEGNTVFMISNTNPMHWEEYIRPMFCSEGYTLEDYFNRVFLSYELHLFKPERAMYAEVEKYIPAGDEVIYIDDAEKNRLAAPDTWRTMESINALI